MNIGDKLRTFRKQNKLTLKELSINTGLSISFISDIENKRRNPSIDTLKVLAGALNISISEFLGEENSLNYNNNFEPVVNETELLDEDAKSLLKKIKKLSKENREKALKMLDIFFNETN